MELPRLNYREYPGANGEVVMELDKESVERWTQYLAEQNRARIALNDVVDK